MPTKITVYICFVLICGHRSQSSSSSSSIEGSVETQGRIGLLVPEIPEFPKEQKKTKFERTKHIRNLSNDREREIFRDDFNISVENINSPRSELDYERDDFQNTPKLPIIKKSHIPTYTTYHPPMDRNNKFIDDLTAHKRVSKHYTHKPRKEVERAHKYTRIITDFEPETPKKKRKHVKPHKVVSDELDKANAKFLAKMKKAKKSKDQRTSDISKDKTRKDQNNNWNKHKLLENHSKSQNKHILREVQNHKKNNKDRHSQPESNKEKRPSSHEKQNIRKKIKSFSDVLPEMSADFVESAIKRPKKLPFNKNINDSPNPRKNEFTLTISDMDENEDNTKEIPYDTFGDSPLLNIHTSKYQSKHKAEPHEPYKQILRENNNDKLKSAFKDSKAENQKPIEIGMIDIPEQFDGKLYDKVDGLVENIKNEHKDAHVEDFFHKKPDGQHVVENKPIKNIHDSAHLQPQEPESKVDSKSKPNMPINKFVLKKNFDASLKVLNKEAQSTRKQEVEALGDDFSKAEILLTDNERDKLAESDDADEKTPLRYSGGGSKKDKRFIGCLGKKALKICRKACRGAYTNVCKRVKCSRNAKRDLKYECTKSCKQTFGTSKYSSESSSSSSSSSFSLEKR